MILEAQLEEKFIENLSTLLSNDVQFIGSRLEDKTEAATEKSILAIATGFRTHDNFSLSPVTIPITFTLCTKVEVDETSENHNSILETLINKLSYWHKHGDEMTDDLSVEKCKCYELKIDGGTSQKYDKANHIWTDTINISIRGAEIFNT